MKKIKKLLIALLTVCLLAGAFATPVIAAPKDGWVKQGGSWYYYSDGEYDVGWNRIGGKWYFFNYKNGRMQTGWLDSKEGYYYLGGSGAMTTGWKKIGGKWYYFSRAGVMQIGWKKIGGKWYYLNPSGAMSTGWKNIGGKWYYLNGGGAMQTGWQKIGGKWYHFENSGKMNTGWKDIDGQYYFGASGALRTGWFKESGKWYYAEAGKGIYKDELVNIGGKLYWFGKDGALAKGGWITIKVLTDENYHGFFELTQKQAYADENGAIRTGWFQMNGKWYYACDQGYIYTKGIKKIDGSFYYFDGNGVMASNGFTYYRESNDLLDERDCGVYATESGKLKTGWFTVGEHTYYAYPKNGELAMAFPDGETYDGATSYEYRVKIDGVEYCFDQWGRYMPDYDPYAVV